MIAFNELCARLETEPFVVKKFQADGDFAITAGTFAAKIAAQLGFEKEAAGLVKAMGADTELFRFRARREGSSLPIAIGPGVFATTDDDSAVAAVFAADLTPVEATFVESRIGPGGYSVVKIGTVEARVNHNVSTEIRDALQACREEEITAPQYEPTPGAPAAVIASPYDKAQILTLRPVPQRDLPPWAEIVPMNVDLTVTEILASSRQYGSQRITVTTPDGEVINGLIATAPIVKALTGSDKGDAPLTEAVLGQKFQILGVEERRRRDGEPVRSDNGTVQKQVLVRNSTHAPLDVEL
jgi:hypothetical protein